MDILVCGSRTLTTADYPKLEQALNELIKPEHRIVHGGAEGADMLTELWCRRHNRETVIVRPDYRSNLPHLAPLIRNEQMVRMTEATIAIINGDMTNGTGHAVKYSRKWKHPVMVVNLKDGHKDLQTELPL